MKTTQQPDYVCKCALITHRAGNIAGALRAAADWIEANGQGKSEDIRTVEISQVNATDVFSASFLIQQSEYRGEYGYGQPPCKSSASSPKPS